MFQPQIELQDPFVIALNTPGPTDIRVLRGDLAGVAGYDVQEIQEVSGAQFFVDTYQPPPETGVYYLVQYACAGASWQSGGENEGNRDDALP